MAIVCILFISIVTLSANAENVILMVADGAGYNAFNAASYYEYGELGAQPYDKFPVQLSCTTDALKRSGKRMGYDPNQYWSDFDYALKNATDSAAAVTALCTGEKTLPGRISTDIDGEPLQTIAEITENQGGDTGVVTTVYFNHATPAGVYAHNISRNNLEEISKEMIMESGLDVIAGAGHPYYNNNGEKLSAYNPSPSFADKKFFTKLQTGQLGWEFFDTKTGFASLASEKTNYKKVFALAPVRGCTQYNREGDGMGDKNKNVPSLSVMTKGALNFLSENEKGFFILIEGGAVDWANHGNNIARMVEEQIDFNKAVKTAVEWVEENSSWDETLLIITSDHECGYIWGPDSGQDSETPYQLPVNNGKGNLPSVEYHSGGHSNSLVPLYAIGKGSELFNEYIDGTDTQAAQTWDITAEYVDNTDVFAVMKRVITAGIPGN